uniref:Uncharacterized protein n=1 Tax=Strix occidentalis caurina TaxID=311401 RepID=A0A8D0KXF7_STROC
SRSGRRRGRPRARQPVTVPPAVPSPSPPQSRHRPPAARHRPAAERAGLVLFCFQVGQQTSADPLTGYLVLSEGARLQRGKCCGSACRRCPYEQVNVKDQSKKKRFDSFFLYIYMSINVFQRAAAKRSPSALCGFYCWNTGICCT